ncbi:MAG TPA: hypothetical protein VLJ39_04315 [Tepidisphaeraceae bacterium]|nr:hypothetical protein [Tepidisphaeraceae bacterium]
MRRLIEILFGLDKGFLTREGAKGLSFNPVWPGHHAALWNTALALLAAVLIVYVYRRDGRSRPARILLGCIRGLLVAFVLVLLNRPVLVNVDTRTEQSVLAVLIDDTASMKIPDVTGDNRTTRLDAARNLLLASNDQTLQKLERTHTLRFYTFDSNATPIGPSQPITFKEKDQPAAQHYNAQLAQALRALKPDGKSTQVVSSLLTVMDDLQGQRLAGVVVMTDGRETPRPADEALINVLKDHHVKVFPVSIGGDKSPPNVYLTSVEPLDVAFKDDIVAVKTTVGATGFPKGHQVRLTLIDKKSGLPLVGMDDRPAERIVELTGDRTPVNTEILFKPKDLGILNIEVVAEKQPNELDYADNVLPASLEVVDSSINVLYVEGYPRWEYRYIKNGMIRDTTVNISCLLTSADVGFVQEGDHAVPPDGPDRGKKFPGPITRFPESIEELMPYDVVLFGDVDPRQFTDRQLQLVADFVGKRGGGFGMVAGPRWAPIAYRNSPLEAVLPVNITRAVQDDPTQAITEGFRPVLTPPGAASTIYRFYPNEQQNQRFMKEDLQPLFWYSRGVTRKSIAQVYSEHPFDIGPDGQKAPILVVGRYGAGRTLFSASDDTWRWRYYTGESVFNTYWVQQLRYLARGKKIGGRDHDLFVDRPTYDLGDEIRVTYRVYNPTYLQQLPPEIPVQLKKDDGTVIAEQKLQRQEGQPDLYTGSFVANREGEFTAHLTSAAGERDKRFGVKSPRLEMEDVSVNHPLLSRIALETRGQAMTLADAPAQLAAIPSLERQTPNPTSNPLWNGWAPLIIFVLLITSEWVLRKVYGML